MSMPERAGLLLLTGLLACAPAGAQTAGGHGFGSPIEAADLARFFSIPPDGRGLPPGKGTAREGASVFAERCAACHGEKLQGNMQPGIGADRLIGGRGTLASSAPVKTVESYWPHATTLFDYIKRAMPFDAPGSLTDDEVYAVSAYILAQGGIIENDYVLDAQSLPKVQMPNRNGFIPDPRPELSLYR